MAVMALPPSMMMTPVAIVPIAMAPMPVMPTPSVVTPPTAMMHVSAVAIAVTPPTPVTRLLDDHRIGLSVFKRQHVG
jgi:hypothetical protein